MKQTILLIIIVAAVAGAGVFGYMALTKSGPDAGQAMPAAGASSQILPMGSALNFDTIQKYNKNSTLFPYPVVNPVEIGVPTSQMIK